MVDNCKLIEKPSNRGTIYLYKTTNLINGKIYVGVRAYHRLDVENDTYIGCGVFKDKKGNTKFRYENKKSPFCDAVREFGYSAFKKEILLYFDSLEIALQTERQVVDELFIQSDNTYNKVIGGGLPPSYSGVKNGNFGNFWSDKKKKDLSIKKKEQKLHVGVKNAKSKACDLYDFLLDKRYSLKFMREAEPLLGLKLDYNWNSLMSFRYLFLSEGEDPYERVKLLVKPMTTIQILDYIKRGISKEDCKQESGLSKNFINRVYKTILDRCK